MRNYLRVLILSWLAPLWAPVGCHAQEAPSPAVAPVTMPREFDDYIARPEPVYKWEKTAPLQNDGGTITGDALGDMMLAALGQDAQVTDLQLTSQTWQGGVWRHRLQVVKPAKVTHPDAVFLFITFGGGSAQEMALAKVAANLTGAPSAVLYDVPNQPLFGLKEDALISHSFVKYLETNDATWPLLFPMAKSVVKAMDAVGEFSEKEWGAKATKFIVTGASKRGWTSWMAAAADKRVIGIVPMVYDNLNLAQQMPHQLKSWGAYSRSISDYTQKDLPAALQTPRGQYLGAMVDPWTYRSRFTMPKLIVNAANDSYWPLDALSLYRAGLPGRTDVLYAPNAGHAMGGQELRVFGSASAWVRRLLEEKPVPSVSLMVKPNENGAATYSFTVGSTEKLGAARLWVARSATRDFRKAQWKAVRIENITANETAQSASGTIEAPGAETPFSAVFAEVDVSTGGVFVPLRLSSDVSIWQAK